MAIPDLSIWPAFPVTLGVTRQEQLMPNVDCTGKDTVTRTFRYDSDKDQFADIWHFRVHNIPPLASGEVFDLSVTLIATDTVQITAIANHNDPAYVGMGIPDALLPTVSQQLGKKLCSSPNSGVAGVFRTPAATKMWARLRSHGSATYDADADIYTLQ